MIRRVLLPLDDSPSAYTAMQYAIDLYHRHKTFLSTMAIVDRPGIESAMTSMGIGSSSYAREGRKEMLRQQEQKAYELLARFGELCSQEGIPHVDREVMDAPLHAIIASSLYVDLVVMGVNSCQPYAEEDPAATIRRVAREASCAVLSTPDFYRPIRKCVVCFNGSVPSARAMHQFAQLNPFALDELIVLGAGSAIERGILEQAAEFLRAHGHDPKVVLLSGRANPELPAFIEKEEIDLVVLGPHSGTIKKLFFGSLSESLIEQRKVSLFMYD